MAIGTVREWYDEDGWGVLESEATPGGCWVHFSMIEMAGHRRVKVGDPVRFVWEPADQDGYAFRAERVWPTDADPFGAPEVDPGPRVQEGPGWRVVEPDPAGNDHHDLLASAERRAAALASGDADNLTAVLHPEFTWTTHRGDRLDRASYVRGNTDGSLRWLEQRLDDVETHVVGDTGVLTCVVHDRVVRDGAELDFTMPVTQTWVRSDGSWRCLAGHAGPALGA